MNNYTLLYKILLNDYKYSIAGKYFTHLLYYTVLYCWQVFHTFTVLYCTVLLASISHIYCTILYCTISKLYSIGADLECTISAHTMSTYTRQRHASQKLYQHNLLLYKFYVRSPALLQLHCPFMSIY